MYLIFATTSELYLKIAILYVKIADTKHGEYRIKDYTELYPKKWTRILCYRLGDLNS